MVTRYRVRTVSMHLTIISEMSVKLMNRMFYPLKKAILTLTMLLPFMMVNGNERSDSLQRIVINATDAMQYDLVRFKVKPGAQVRIILTNKGDMDHNLVLTLPGSRQKVVAAASKLGENGTKLNYVPSMPEVTGFIRTLTAGQTDSITFYAAKKEGAYPYVCTFPGHGAIMYGVMHVTENEMPDFQEDPNIPLSRKSAVNTAAEHPYKLIPPFLYRIFVPGASPAAITVSLPQQISYCWDAGACRLRYAWKGGFLDNTTIWKGHFDAYADIVGTIFYRDKTAYPLHMDKPGNVPNVSFKGYRLIARYPEFHYSINGIEVFELLKAKADGSGLTRTFRILNNNRTIWFVVGKDDGIDYKSSNGRWIDGSLKLTPLESREFTITMTIRK